LRERFSGFFCRSRSATQRTRGVRVAALAVLMMAAAPVPAAADFFLTPFAAVKFAGDARIVDLDHGASNSKFALGVIAGVLGDGMFGAEADVTYVPRFFDRSSGTLVASSQVLTIMGNVIVAAPRELTGYSLRPFLSGGAGLMHITIDDVAGILPVKSNLFGINAGGGAVGALTNVLDVRFEVRYFKSITTEDAEGTLGGSSLSYWRAAIGLTIR
jgi:hypothetical protein